MDLASFCYGLLSGTHGNQNNYLGFTSKTLFFRYNCQGTRDGCFTVAAPQSKKEHLQSSMHYQGEHSSPWRCFSTEPQMLQPLPVAVGVVTEVLICNSCWRFTGQKLSILQSLLLPAARLLKAWPLRFDKQQVMAWLVQNWAALQWHGILPLFSAFVSEQMPWQWSPGVRGFISETVKELGIFY